MSNLRNTIHLTTVREKFLSSLCVRGSYEMMIRHDLYHETRIEYGGSLRWIFHFPPTAKDETPSKLNQLSVTDESFMFWVRERDSDLVEKILDLTLSHDYCPIIDELTDEQKEIFQENFQNAGYKNDPFAGMKKNKKKKLQTELEKIEELKAQHEKRLDTCPI